MSVALPLIRVRSPRRETRLETTPGAAGPRPGAAPAGHVALAGAELVLALEDAFDLDVLERRLMAFAVHADGLAAEGAWLLLWNQDRRHFELGALLRALPAGIPLGDALKSPGLPPPRGEDDRLTLDPAALDPPLE